MSQTICQTQRQTHSFCQNLLQMGQLLELPVQDLNRDAQQAQEENPLLEICESEHPENQRAIAGSGQTETDVRPQNSLAENPAETRQRVSSRNSRAAKSKLSDAFDKQQALENTALKPTLRAHLLSELNVTSFTETDRIIAETIIDDINPDGYLTSPLDELHATLEVMLDVDFVEIEAVLRRIQNFDPPGVGGRDLAECLELQLQQINDDTPWKQEAIALVTTHKESLYGIATGKSKAFKMESSAIDGALQLIRTLNPKPGSVFFDETKTYVTPDVIVRKIDNEVHVELNVDALPKLRVKSEYHNMVAESGQNSDIKKCREQLSQANDYVNNITERNDTLLAVVRQIVWIQRAFFERGESAMRPLVRRDVAKNLDIWESTVSRATKNKYVQTPNGVVPISYFFSSRVKTDTFMTSATAVKARIKDLITNEEAKRPLSDQKLVTLLTEQGINIARRTVTKYREALGIPCTRERKSCYTKIRHDVHVPHKQHAYG